MADMPRVRESDGAVWIEGLGYVTELFSYGGKAAAGEAARPVIAESIAKQQAGELGQGRSGSDARKREQMGFG